MGGSAAVLGAARAISEMRPPGVEVHVIVAACENMINGSAVHPGDILTASNGKTIEINNTDAEGRLTLADALVYACKLEPDAVVDLATLTGACVIALGEEIAGLWSNNDGLAEALQSAATQGGESLWRMPLRGSYKEGLKSGVADLKNTGPRPGGSITAALFLQDFLSPDMAAGSGLGPRHGSGSIGQGLGSLVPPDLRDPAQVIPNQMSSMLDAMEDGRIKNLMLFGTNMLSSFPQRARLSRALQALDLVVSHDLFMNETAASHAQLVLPSTAWLEELGCKMTHTHLYLSDALLAPEGECRSTYQVLNDLARLLSLEGFHPWKDVEAMFDAVIDQPFTGHASIASLRAGQGRAALKVSHIGHADLHFDTPSGKLELYSEQAEHLGLSPLPDMPLDEIEIVMTELDLKGHHSISSDDDLVPISERVFRLAQGRTLHHFHGFYNNGTALPSLANKDAEPWVLMASADAHALDLKQDDPIVLYNKLGRMAVHVRLHERLPQGTLWIRDGWPQLNALSDASPILPDAAVDLFRFSAGQSRFDPRVYLARAIG
ncbi:MAG: molybdopterin-dependent oxidoreductase, partial [Burkholderiaceae bacterium]